MPLASSQPSIRRPSSAEDELPIGMLLSVRCGLGHDHPVRIEVSPQVSHGNSPGSPDLDPRQLAAFQQVVSNSRPSKCDSSRFAHFDSDKMIRHHRDVEKDWRYGLLEPEPARFRRWSACFGS